MKKLLSLFALAVALVVPSFAQNTTASFGLSAPVDCGAATSNVSCVISIPPVNDLGIYPNMQVNFNPTTGLGTVQFETFQLVENGPGPYLSAGAISHAAPVWNVVTSNGHESYQITDLTIYAYGSYAPASGLPACAQPVIGNPNCWVIKPAYLHFTYRAIVHVGGSITWERSFTPSAEPWTGVTFSQIQ